MPARPIWRGHLRLALVSCPVALWNAKHDRATIRFNHDQSEDRQSDQDEDGRC